MEAAKTAVLTYAAIEALAADIERTQSDLKKLKKLLEDKERLEYEAWVASGCPDMEAKDGDELREWRKVGFPMWFKIKSLKTFEPVKMQKQKQSDNGAGNLVVPGDTDSTALKTFEPVKQDQSGNGAGNPVVPGDTSSSSKATSTPAYAMLNTAFGIRKAITNTPLPAGKDTVLGGGPLVEYTFDDEYREDQKAYMKANGLKGLSASRWA